MNETELSHAATRTAEYLQTSDLDGNSWITGVAINGLLSTEESEFVETARDLVDTAVATQADAGQLGYGPSYPIEIFSHGREYDTSWELTVNKCINTNNTTAIGHGVLDFYARTDDDTYLTAARRAKESLLSFERTADGAIPHHDPKQAGMRSLWIDSVYMMCPFLARLGTLDGDEEAFDEAAKQLLVHAKHLQDPATGLFRHIWVETPNHYPQGAFWARGNGWAAAALVEVLDRLPANHPDRDDLVEMLRTLGEALIALQDGSGFWHNLVDDPNSPLETSGTTMFAYAFTRALDLGLLEGEQYREAAVRALEASVRVVDDDGAVTRVAGPPGGPEAPLTDTPYGQGWFLMAAHSFL